MPIWDILAIAAGLGADAMSVSAAVGVKWHGPHQRFRLAWHMGLFQFFMPLVGWAVGSRLAGLLRTYGRIAAAVLVAAVGAKMLLEAVRSRPGEVAERAEHAAEAAMHLGPKDPTRGWSLVILSVATSLDALVVGFSLGLRGEGRIVLPSLVIGFVAAMMALAGIMIGKCAGAAFGRKAEIAGAIVLIVLGASFLWM